MDGRDTLTDFNSSLPDSVTNDDTGRLTFGASWCVRGMCPGLHPAGRMTRTHQRSGDLFVRSRSIVYKLFLNLFDCFFNPLPKIVGFLFVANGRANPSLSVSNAPVVARVTRPSSAFFQPAGLGSRSAWPKKETVSGRLWFQMIRTNSARTAGAVSVWNASISFGTTE